MQRVYRPFPAILLLALMAPSLAVSQTSGSGQAGSEATATADAAAEARIRAAIDHAASVGVPLSMLENKVAEGRAKGVPLARIAAAMEHRAEVLARVKSAMESRFGAVSEGELTAGADANEAGVSLDQLSRVGVQAGNDRSMALTVLADLVANGQVPEHALLRVQAALNGGVGALTRLGNSAEARAGAEARGNAGITVGSGTGIGVGIGKGPGKP